MSVVVKRTSTNDRLCNCAASSRTSLPAFVVVAELVARDIPVTRNLRSRSLRCLRNPNRPSRRNLPTKLDPRSPSQKQPPVCSTSQNFLPSSLCSRYAMGQKFDHITPELIKFIQKQEMFWVATAPLSGTGHVNVSPKGVRGTFHIDGPNKGTIPAIHDTTWR